MRELDETLKGIGFSVRCITIGSQEKADEFCGRHGVFGLCIGDEDMHTYRSIGLGDLDLSQLQSDPALVQRRAENEAAGFRQDWDATRIEDAAQLPGAVVIDADGVIRWMYRGAHPGDLPPMRELVARAREALEAS